MRQLGTFLFCRQLGTLLVVIGDVLKRLHRTRVDAVSYTHLDVYKRQILSISFRRASTASPLRPSVLRFPRVNRNVCVTSSARRRDFSAQQLRVCRPDCVAWANEAHCHVIGIFHLLCRFPSRAYVRPRISKGEAGSLSSHVDYGGMKSTLCPCLLYTSSSLLCATWTPLDIRLSV